MYAGRILLPQSLQPNCLRMRLAEPWRAIGIKDEIRSIRRLSAALRIPTAAMTRPICASMQRNAASPLRITRAVYASARLLPSHYGDGSLVLRTDGAVADNRCYPCNSATACSRVIHHGNGKKRTQERCFPTAPLSKRPVRNNKGNACCATAGRGSARFTPDTAAKPDRVGGATAVRSACCASRSGTYFGKCSGDP